MAQDDDEGIDFALVAFREENVWRLEDLRDDVLGDVDAIAAELRRWPGDFGSLGLVSVDEDFFVLMRVAGDQRRILLSDVTAANDWALARSVLEALEIPLPEDDDEQLPAGDLAVVADLGLSAMDLGVLLDDEDLYPDEILAEVAHKLGFGALFDEAVGFATS